MRQLASFGPFLLIYELCFQIVDTRLSHARVRRPWHWRSGAVLRSRQIRVSVAVKWHRPLRSLANSMTRRAQTSMLPKLSGHFVAYAFALSLACAVSSLGSVPAWSQDAPTDDVHLHPRTVPEEAKGAEVDPSLRTHTKPIVKDVDLVLVPVTVTDPLNRLVTGLEKENFVVFEGNDREEIKHFSSEDAPISLGVIFDVSGSMADKIDKSRDAVIEFFKTANPDDEFFLIT